jgi:serine/threonine protein kinase
VVKHPRVEPGGLDDADVLSELATELQILRHPPLRQHANNVDLLGVMYHDAGDTFAPNVLPALVLDYAELGSVKDYQQNGYGLSYADKLDILIDTAKGLEALHSCGIIHGDVKTSNFWSANIPSESLSSSSPTLGFHFLRTMNALSALQRS